MKHRLVLLFGMPRSGTTWIAKIFDSHPETLYRHEPDRAGTLNRIPFYPDVKKTDLYSDHIQAFVGALWADRSLRVAGSLPVFPKNYCSSRRLFMHRCAIGAARATEAIGWNLPIPVFALGNNGRAPLLVWKSIESLGRLGVLTRALPESRAIVILRHPCAYIASVMAGEAQHRFSDSQSSSDDWEVYEWLLDAFPHRENTPSLEELKGLAPVERLAWRWVLSNEKALMDTAGAESCAYVRYEDICADPMEKSWELLNFAGLPWHEQVMQFVQRSTAHHSQRYYSVFKDPALTVNRWQTEMRKDDIDLVMAIVRKTPLAALYGIKGTTKVKRYGSLRELERLSAFS
ncbi:MAG TPA: sulfotransferase [Candidatus Binatia bacterium]|jgi:hypothetical protein